MIAVVLPKMTSEYILHSEQETAALAANIARRIKPGDILTFSGDLGSGKTFLCREIIKELCGQDTKVISPTFNLLQIYEIKNLEVSLALYHFDLYRLKTLDEIYELAIEEAFAGQVCLIEWPEIISNILPKDTISIEISIVNETTRLVVVST